MHRALVVENSPEQSRELVAILESAGLEVESFADGQRGLERFLADPFDVVLSDVHLPGLDGYDLCREVKAQPTGRHIPVVLLAPGRQATDVLEALECGADHFITVPCAPDELGARLRSILGGARFRSQPRADGGVEAVFRGRRVTVEADRERLLDLLLSSVDELARSRRELQVSDDELARLRRRIDDCEERAHRSERLATLGTLALGIAHEINTPLAFMLADLEVLKTYPAALRGIEMGLRRLARDPEATSASIKLEELLASRQVGRAVDELDELACAFAQGGERIRDIVQDLKSFVRVDDSEVALLRVNDCIESALRIAQHEVKYRARLEKSLDPDLPDIVAHPGKLSQLFVNLIVNAAQSIEEGESARQSIRVASVVDGSCIRIDVSDTGRGIAPDVLPRIFDPFFTTKGPGKGTGLGLSICREIVVAHGGNIRVESKLGEGTTFSVQLPRQTIKLVPRAVPPSPQPDSVPRSRLLTVDDDPYLLKAYRRIIGDRHHVVTALGGAAALTALEEVDGDFDVILCDMLMPEIDAVTLHRRVAAGWPGLERRMVFITGGAFTDRSSQFLAGLDNPRLDKPFGLGDLQRAIAAALARSGRA